MPIRKKVSGIDFAAFLGANVSSEEAVKLVSILKSKTEEERLVIQAYVFAAISTGNQSKILDALDRISDHGKDFFVLEIAHDHIAWAEFNVTKIYAYLENFSQAFAAAVSEKDPEPLTVPIFPEEEYAEIIPQ